MDVHVAHIDEVRLCLRTEVSNWPVVYPQMIMSMESHGGMLLTGENRRTRRKSVPVPLCPPQNQHGLT
jgi:hypothetical protein